MEKILNQPSDNEPQNQRDLDAVTSASAMPPQRDAPTLGRPSGTRRFQRGVSDRRDGDRPGRLAKSGSEASATACGSLRIGQGLGRRDDYKQAIARIKEHFRDRGTSAIPRFAFFHQALSACPRERAQHVAEVVDQHVTYLRSVMAGPRPG
jgi:hypothetical protein